MAEINLNLDNQNIINDYFKDLTCDDYKESIFKGGQSFADQALSNLDISGYATVSYTHLTLPTSDLV